MTTMELVNLAEAIFGPGVKVVSEEMPLERRLELIDQVLAQRNSSGNIGYTQTEIESCIIGLRRYGAQSDAAAEMLDRLQIAMTKALTWDRMAATAQTHPNRKRFH